VMLSLSALRGPGMLRYAMPCYALLTLLSCECVLEGDRLVPCWRLHDVSPWDGLPFHLASAVLVPKLACRMLRVEPVRKQFRDCSRW
jgi:hypothetical protein